MSSNALKVSFVVPTFNSARTLSDCLRSIREQDYPAQCIEVVVADAGSSDATVQIAGEFRCDRIVDNPLRTGEAGKTAGIRATTGEIIALVDSDNVLDSAEWLKRMLEPFDDPSIVASEPMSYTRREFDPALTRYFAMLGMSDPLCLFLGNYDRTSLISGKWTGLDVDTKDRGNFFELALSADNLPTIGANGFVLRRSLLNGINWDPYFFDIDIMYQAVMTGRNRVAKVKCGIVHLYCKTLRDFARKQDRRINDFLFFSNAKQRTYPWTRQKRAGLIRFCFATVLVFPLLLQMARGWRRQPDRAWLLHVPTCWITLWVYGIVAARKALGFKPAVRTRDGWKQ